MSGVQIVNEASVVYIDEANVVAFVNRELVRRGIDTRFDLDPIALAEYVVGQSSSSFGMRQELIEVVVACGRPGPTHPGHRRYEQRSAVWQARDARVRLLDRPLSRARSSCRRCDGVLECVECGDRGPKWKQDGVDVLLAVDLIESVQEKGIGHVALVSSDSDFEAVLQRVERLPGVSTIATASPASRLSGKFKFFKLPSDQIVTWSVSEDVDARIRERRRKGSRQRTLRRVAWIPYDKIGLLIGQRGSTVKSLEEASGVAIHVNKKETDQGGLVMARVTIRGATDQNVEDALAAIAEIIPGVN